MLYRLEKTETGKRWVKNTYNPETQKIDKIPLKEGEKIILDPDSLIEGSEVMFINQRVFEKKYIKEPLPSFEEWLDQLELEAPTPTEFTPCVFYNAEGDLLEIYINNEPSCARRIGINLDIMESVSSKKITGITVWGLKNVMLKEQCGNDNNISRVYYTNNEEDQNLTDKEKAKP